jgi:uncharacterized tellurite resistance protein B-like protein
VAWADGEVSEEELRHLRDALQAMAGVHRGEVDRLAGSQSQVDPKLLADLKAVPPGDACDILKLAFRIASADRAINDRELDVMKAVSGAILPDKPWKLVHAWISAHLAFINATRELFKQPA